MRRWARAAPAIAIGALAAIATVTATAPARARAGAATMARVAASTPASSSSDAALVLTPVGAAPGAGVAVEVDPGASAQRSFVVTNRSNSLRVTVRLAGVDATVRSGGTVQYAHAASVDGPGGWLTLSDVVTTLEPGASVRVSMTVSPPGNATPGELTAGLVANIDHAARASDNQTVDAPGEVALPVTIKVNGAPTALVSIASVKAVEDGGHAFLDITFQNSGATPATMSGQVRVAGTHPRTDPVRATIPPLTHTNVRVPFAMPSGSHTVPVSVTTKDAGGNDATWAGDVGSGAAIASASVPSASSTTARHDATPRRAHRSAFPSPALVLGGLVVLAFLAAAVWFGLELRRTRVRRRAPAAPCPAPAAVFAAPVSVAPAAGAADTGQMGAVAAQLGALVAAIDRLVSRLGDGTVPPAVAKPPPHPHASSGEPAPANPAPMFYGGAASREQPEVFDPYDWPTQEQLDQFARRRATQSDS